MNPAKSHTSGVSRRRVPVDSSNSRPKLVGKAETTVSALETSASVVKMIVFTMNIIASSI